MTAVEEALTIASTGIRAHLVIRLTELGIRDAEEQRNVVERWTRGRTRRRSELTPAEAESLARRLRSITPAEIAAVARPTGPAPRVEKESAPPQRSLDAAACLASWDEPDTPLTPEPVPEPEPERVERRSPDPVAIAAEVALAPLLAPGDAPDVVEPAEPPAPAEPGWNPAWPSPAADGWTGPVMANGKPNPTGLGPYCMGPPGTCYCGGCLHYVPLPPADSKEYREQVRNALRKASEKNDKKGRR